MPVIRLDITTGCTRDQKREIVEQFTRTLQDVAGKSPEHIHIIIAETDEDSWGYHGSLTDEWRANRQGGD